MMGYDAGLMALALFLDRVDYGKEGSVGLRMKDLDLGDVHFVSGVVRFEADARGNGKH